MLSRCFAHFLVAAGAGLRLLFNFFQMFNFNPMGAIGIFGGARLRSWQAFAVPLSIMVATDILLTVFIRDQRYSLTDPSRPFVYGSYLIYVLIGRFVIGASNKPVVIAAGSLLGAAQFFLITNFQAWLTYDHLYSRDLAGLAACYLAAIPFVKYTLLSDLVFTPTIFALHAWATKPSAEVALAGESGGAS